MPVLDFGCSSRHLTLDFLLQDFSPARHLASGLTMFSCPSSSFSTQDNGFIKFSQSRHSVFDYASRPAMSSFVDAHCAVFSSGQFNYTGICIPVPSQLNIPAWRTLLQDYEDSVICDFLEFGWPLGYTNQTLPVFHLRTHRGTLNFPSAVQDYLNSLSRRINIKSALSCIMHGIRSCASFFSWLLAKGNPSLYPHVPSNHSLYIL